jgi:hypothetical protein
MNKEDGDMMMALKATAEERGGSFTELVALACASRAGFIDRLRALGYTDPARILKLHDILLSGSPARIQRDPKTAAPKVAETPHDPTGFVGTVVTIHALKGRPELNGARGRAVRYDAESGRLAVLVKDVGKLALKPSNLMSEEARLAAERREREATAQRQADDERRRRQMAAADEARGLEKWTWGALLRRLSLEHLGGVPFESVQDKISEHAGHGDLDAIDGLLAREGVESAEERALLVEELMRFVRRARKPRAQQPAAGGLSAEELGISKAELAMLSSEMAINQADMDDMAGRAAYAADGVTGEVTATANSSCANSSAANSSCANSSVADSSEGDYESEGDDDGDDGGGLAMLEAAFAKVQRGADATGRFRVIDKMLFAKMLRKKDDPFASMEDLDEPEVAKPAPPPAERAPDAGMEESHGQTFYQRYGDLSRDGAAKPLPPKGALFPSCEQAGLLAGFYQARGIRLTICFTDQSAPAKEARLLEGMLEHRGCQVVACAAHAYSDESDPGMEYSNERAYCKEVRRIGPSTLYKVTRQETTGLLFQCAWITPWRAYLARYPHIKVVTVINVPRSEANVRKQDMMCDALDGVDGWQRVLTTPIHAHMARSLECVVYERSKGA